ncbi:MAG TPA: hypothetical protein VGL89_11030 [Candidatus Koribacter sp.]|jgi:hypothetical protein
MAKELDLPYGPYALTDDDIRANVSGSLAGAYALGFTVADGIFDVDFVGRSADDLRRKLLLHTPYRHPEFIFTYCRDEAEAYERECELYHEFHPRDNLVHPAPPLDSRRSCKICGHHR